MQASGTTFIAAVGTVVEEGRLQGEIERGGPQEILGHLSELIAKELG